MQNVKNWKLHKITSDHKNNRRQIFSKLILLFLVRQMDVLAFSLIVISTAAEVAVAAAEVVTITSLLNEFIDLLTALCHYTSLISLAVNISSVDDNCDSHCLSSCHMRRSWCMLDQKPANPQPKHWRIKSNEFKRLCRLWRWCLVVNNIDYVCTPPESSGFSNCPRCKDLTDKHHEWLVR